MLNPQDLQRVSAEKAAAVLVLCNKFSSDPSKNILSSANVLREYQEKDMTPESIAIKLGTFVDFHKTSFC